jgi:hypothetical protein
VVVLRCKDRQKRERAPGQDEPGLSDHQHGTCSAAGRVDTDAVNSLYNAFVDLKIKHVVTGAIDRKTHDPASLPSISRNSIPNITVEVFREREKQFRLIGNRVG